jgi:hypothetical protein
MSMFSARPTKLRDPKARAIVTEGRFIGNWSRAATEMFSMLHRITGSHAVVAPTAPVPGDDNDQDSAEKVAPY